MHVRARQNRTHTQGRYMWWHRRRANFVLSCPSIPIQPQNLPHVAPPQCPQRLIQRPLLLFLWNLVETQLLSFLRAQRFRFELPVPVFLESVLLLEARGASLIT